MATAIENSKKLSLKVSIHVDASVDKVWNALTDPKQIKKYLFGTDTLTDWEQGSPITFKGEYEGKKYEDKGRVIAAEKYDLIQYTYWSSMSGLEDRPENYTTVTYKLTGNIIGTTLTVTQENIQNEEARQHSEENWKKVLEEFKRVVEN